MLKAVCNAQFPQTAASERRHARESRLQPVGDVVAYAEAVRGRDALLRVRISP